MLDKFLRDLIHGEFSIGKTKVAFLDILLTVCITGTAALIRKSIFGISGNPGLENEGRSPCRCSTGSGM